MKITQGLQKMLPFGYLFLVVMGLLKESVFFYQIGVNILKYSTVMDVLISPIATLTSHPVVLGAVIFLILFSYAIPSLLSKKRDKKWVQKIASLKNIEKKTEEEIGIHFTNLFIASFAMVLLSFFLGIGIGQGQGLKKKIAAHTIKYDHKLNYNSGESEEIYLINTNSIYYFYLAKGNKSIKIAPIGAVKSIEITNNKMLK